MFGYGAEAVILGNTTDVVLAVVLAQGLVVPCDAFLHIPSIQFRLLHNLVERCADTNKLFLCHAAICGRLVAVLLFFGCHKSIDFSLNNANHKSIINYRIG